MRRLVPAFFALLFPVAGWAQPAPDSNAGIPNLPPLVGQIEGDTYISPTGAFKIRIPVLPELGGTVTDTPNVVTFRDPFSTLISIAAIPEDATQKWKLETMGPRDYLKDFFLNNVWKDFSSADPQAQLDTNARFLPSAFGGSFITYLMLPGGSMFYDPQGRLATDGKLPVAKRANMLFVHDGFIYVISTELAERVTEGSAYHRTAQEEDTELRDRLLDIANRIRFLKPVRVQ